MKEEEAVKVVTTIGLYEGFVHSVYRGSLAFAGIATLYVNPLLQASPSGVPVLPWHLPGYTITGFPSTMVVEPEKIAALSYQWSFQMATGRWAQCRKSRETQ